MKTFSKFFFTTFLVTLLLSSYQNYSQTVPAPQVPISTPTDLDVGTIDSGAATVTVMDEAVLFYNPATSGPSITLTASVDDGEGNVFDSYQWYLVTADGTENTVTGQTTANLTLSGLAPGYHKYRIYGLLDNEGGTVTCQSEEYQDIILFVLPPLEVETTVNLNGNPLGYCANDIPDVPINLSVTNLTADYSASTNGYENPLGNDFEVTYSWFAVLEGGTANPIDLGTTTDNYDISITDAGSYTFYVEVEYVVKTDDGSRDYITYAGDVIDGSGDPLEITVTPIPGAPTITIGGITD
ncbi:hypothetical protein [Galbibacter sp. PAP.153]|uniref:hypothetical protein n=1 Tax=Galbibacter sp. PAP.153 TaxID=3104623 RepID=UPI003009C2F6